MPYASFDESYADLQNYYEGAMLNRWRSSDSCFLFALNSAKIRLSFAFKVNRPHIKKIGVTQLEEANNAGWINML